ncbi:glycosyl-phosphatidylinositol-anchored molecule-like protein [Prionailurus viverrinus]|uniref:glycosyl-phosphatidylinositol-anchored molecule-like protein n=1 Tax=Prionailurus viverrinus TaxID=61388 RepID=UPI001FF42E39|nr:glycosyl-phosphatidylinositol-anchored molecule-like protein [Prionailurus viverrinus]
MMLLWAFLLVIWLPQVMLGGYWTYNLKCYDCWTINNFFCTSMTLCPKHLRRCVTISVRLGLSTCNDMVGLALVVLVMTEDALGAAVRNWEPTGLWLTSPGASKAHGQVVVGREMHGLGVCLFWAQGGHLGFPGPMFIGLNSRELLVYKNCTSNCTFVYPSEVPDEAPRSKFFKTNSFYFVRCCGSINCNEGGPISLEKDIVHEDIIEERVVAMAHMGESPFSLSIASILVSHTLT